jgi:hypothetical protein
MLEVLSMSPLLVLKSCLWLHESLAAVFVPRKPPISTGPDLAAIEVNGLSTHGKARVRFMDVFFILWLSVLHPERSLVMLLS